MADARIVAFADDVAPSGWLTCDGASLLRADEPELFAAIGTTYGAADADHFSLPDLRGRFALGKAATGTGSTLANAGGALGHTHSLAHSHSVTQPADHAAHVVTQPGGHTTLTHAGFDVDDHPATSHAGMSVAAHSVSATDAHGSHASAGSHDHDSHVTSGSIERSSGPNTVINSSGKHSVDGSHNHEAHSGHNESVSAHSISDQGDSHPIQTHSVTQPAAHSIAAHAFTVGAHGAHSATAAASATVTLAAADPPYLALIFIIAPATTPVPIGALLEHGADAVPTDHLLCNAQAVSRSTYADLFALVGTTFGVGNGTTTFNLPDLRGRHVIGASGAPAFAATGGSANHTHAGASHGHSVTQPTAHADHSVTQPSHPALAHSGAAISAHSMSHAGFSVASHSVTQSSGHGTHDADGSHNHNAHSFSSSWAAGTDFYGNPSTHSNDGSHAHNAHTAHSGAALSAHVESQASTHTASHSVTQPNDHSAMTHSGAALSAHSAHSGAAVNAATSAASAAAEAPYLALNYMIRTSVGGVAVGSLYKVGQAAAPSGSLLAQGQAVSRSTYADLFAAIGTAFGVGDGSTTFNLPDTRGRIPRGANGDLAGSGGVLNHTHAVSATHGHTAVQPDAHGAHNAAQASGHASLSHAGASVATHTLGHAGADINNHSATQASSHSAHSSASNHNHNSHTTADSGLWGTGAFVSVTISPTTHANEGGHSHTGAHTHAGFSVGGHSVGQANAHSLGHTETQPSAHSISAHAGFAVDAHGAHTGFALAAAGTGTTDAGNPPYLVVNYVIQAGVDVFYQAGTTAFVAGGGEFHVDDYELSLHWSKETAFIAGGGEFHVTAYDIELADVPLTPPSSPIIYILGEPT